MKKRDLILIACFLLAALALFGVSRLMAGSNPGTAFVVAIDGNEKLRGSLSVNATYPVEQEDGSMNRVTVKDGYVFMEEANCRDGLCMRQGRTDTAAKTIVCLPHKLTVTVIREDGSQNDDLDVVVQ